MGGQGGGRPGEKGAGGVREAGEEGAGSGIPKVAGSGRKREKIMQHCAIFRNRKMQRAGAKKYRAGTGIKGYGKREVYTPLSPPPLVSHSKVRILIDSVSVRYTGQGRSCLYAKYANAYQNFLSLILFFLI